MKTPVQISGSTAAPGGNPRELPQNGVASAEQPRTENAQNKQKAKTRATTLLLVSIPAALREVVLTAAAEVFPGAQIIPVQSVAEAAKQACAGQRQLILLTDQDEAEVNLAAQATDAQDKPRWAVVVLGRKFTDLAECLTPEECNPKTLGRSMRSALLQHELVRENLQLRGDLKTLAYRLRHDFTGSLHCIDLNCELMTELLGDSVDLVKPQIGNIRKSLSEMGRLLERVDDMLKSSAEPLPTAPFSMEKVIASVLHQLEEEIQQQGTTVRHPETWPQVEGVAKWLEVIWLNLILNAIKHGGQSGSVHLDWGTREDTLRFSVANRGPAVPAAMESQLFTPFERLHTRRGCGLGLCLVERLVSLHGGNCGYERQGEETTVFYFTLPSATSGNPSK